MPIFLAATFCGSHAYAAKPKYPPVPSLTNVAAGEGPTAQQVRDASAKAVAFLYSKLNPAGNWELIPQMHNFNDKEGAEVVGGQWGGRTAITVYALLAAGESNQEPRLKKAIDFLRKEKFVGTYATAFRALVWSELANGQPEFHDLAKRDANALMGAQMANGFTGYYTSPLSHNAVLSGKYDHSNGQASVIGVWACEDAGVEIPTGYWQTADQGWRSHQLADGSWGYVKADGVNKWTASHATMTAAGAATLYLTQGELLRGSGCGGNVRNDSISHAIDWLAANYSIITSQQPEHAYYALYETERVGQASGLKYFKTFDWFDSGAKFLLKQQAADGSWGVELEESNGTVSSTALGLLFLSHGRAPVILTKLQYDTTLKTGKRGEGNWNQRPQDVGNFTRWLGKTTESNLNWQIVNLDAPVEELSDAPLLYITGDQPLDFTPEQQEKLRQFVYAGGTIIANADCSTAAFEQSVTKLGTVLFPSYEFRVLPANHPIYTSATFSNKGSKIQPFLFGLSNGVREFMLLSKQQDLSKAWQSQSSVNKRELYETMANACSYAVDKEFRDRVNPMVIRDAKVSDKRTIRLARLQAGDNWNPEPGGWPRVGNWLHNQAGVNLEVTAVKPGAGELKAPYNVAHLTGTTSFTLNDAARTEIREFVTAGGTLIIDSAGGSGEFSLAAKNELAAIFPNAPLTVLPPEDSIFTANGAPMKIQYRDFARKQVGGLSSPRLQAITLNGRAAVFLSEEDLSAGLVGQPVDGVKGYSPETATQLMGSLLLSAGK